MSIVVAINYGLWTKCGLPPGFINKVFFGTNLDPFVYITIFGCFCDLLVVDRDNCSCDSDNMACKT